MRDVLLQRGLGRYERPSFTRDGKHAHLPETVYSEKSAPGTTEKHDGDAYQSHCRVHRPFDGGLAGSDSDIETWLAVDASAK